MGAINYFTSDYITLGLRPYDTSDFENDTEFMEELQKEIDEYGGTLENALDSYISGCYESDYSNIETELAKHSFYYYHVVIKPGYYEGFTLDIESNFPVCFDGWEDKKDAQKEITELKQFLIDCAGLGLVKCSPGWCTGYSDYNGTITAIRDAVKEMRQAARETPTWAQYEREGAQMEFIIKPLHITQEDEQKRYNQIERKYSRRFVQLVKRMEKQGYYFESMNIKGCYRFNYAGATFPLEFRTQREIAQYIKEIEV